MKIKEGKIITKVKLNGKRFQVFEDALIDTGAAFTVIPPETADFLELKINKKFSQTQLVTASGLIEAPVKILNELEIVNLKVKNLSVVIHKIPDPAPIKILLGMNFINNTKLTIKGKENSFEIEDP